MVVVQFWSLKIFPLEISRVSSRESGRLLREPSIWGHAFLCLGDRGTPTDSPEGGTCRLRHIRGPLPRGAQQPIMAKPMSPEPWCRRRKMRGAISTFTFLSLFAPLTSPTFSLPISPFFCLGNSIHPTPTPRVQTGGAAPRRPIKEPRVGVSLLGCCPRPGPEPARPVTGRAGLPGLCLGLCPRTERLSLDGKRMVSLHVLPFPWRVSVRPRFLGTSRPRASRFGWIFFSG